MPIKQSAWLEYLGGTRLEYQLGSEIFDFRPKEFQGFRMVADIGSVEKARALLNQWPALFTFYFPNDPEIQERNFMALVTARKDELFKFIMEIPDPFIDPLGNPRQPVYDPIGPVVTPLSNPPEQIPVPESPPETLPTPEPAPEARLDAPPSRTQQYRKKYSYSGR